MTLTMPEAIGLLAAGIRAVALLPACVVGGPHIPPALAAVIHPSTQHAHQPDRLRFRQRLKHHDLPLPQRAPAMSWL